MKLHKLKSAPEHFAKYSNDTWSCRINDRDFQKDDLCAIYHINDERQTHLHKIKKVNHNVPGLKENYVILDLKLLEEFV